MLKEIGIKNFVLIEELRLELDKGLNVLTGETGAGKSIVLDAVGLLLGDRFSAESVRQGAERASLDGVFQAPKTRAFIRWWKDHDFDAADELVIRREGYADGRSKAYLNDRPVTLAALQELGTFLVDVHGQNEHQRVLQPAVQRGLLDRFAGLEETAAAIEPLYDAWKALVEKQNAEHLSEQEKMQRIDVYRFQLEEIDKAKLRVGEDIELSQRLPELKNSEKLRSLAASAYETLYDAEGSAIERLGQSERSFEALVHLAPSVEPLLAGLKEAKSKAEEAAHALQALAERWGSDPEALESLLSRMELLSRLQKKYGGTVEAVIAHGEKIRGELDALENADAHRQNLEKQTAAAQAELEKASLALSKKRKTAAADLGKAAQKQLADLGLKQAQFAVAVDTPSPPRFSPNGVDTVVFQWSPNPGEGMRPLKDIASGGEMSRVMLALKTVLAEADAVPTLVFDEVDAGIGGLTAQAVGKKLRALSKHHQILCVSHLPQIASSAHTHFHVSKRVAKSRTFALVERLTEGTRVEEIARMLGSDLTPTSRQHARELLQQNQ